MPPAELHRLAMETVRGWHEGVQRIVREADVEATFALQVYSAQRVEPWDEPAVTLVGDAKASYERRMLDYAFAAVEASREHPFAPRPTG
ncbi:hypothetical protein ETD86_39945 [Nonomuraea turkmeniaca]|uniref:Uncharacterized protein n=1 Tax=Nonomuraea turkmeniaca TaxID=103838 RepID=A0A5S4F358_9ACTN|nr:hypothetical protein [Nonomuraea turkmeniaca]TMR10332.1 hypothetical protein ETD86_39945 [Nonomuraea turkmeniaca]